MIQVLFHFSCVDVKKVLMIVQTTKLSPKGSGNVYIGCFFNQKLFAPKIFYVLVYVFCIGGAVFIIRKLLTVSEHFSFRINYKLWANTIVTLVASLIHE